MCRGSTPVLPMPILRTGDSPRRVLVRRLGRMALTLEKLRTLTTTRLATANLLPIAVDFGTSGLKVLQVTSAESPALVAAAMVPTPEGLLADPNERLNFQVEALAHVLKGGGF